MAKKRKTISVAKWNRDLKKLKIDLFGFDFGGSIGDMCKATRQQLTYIDNKPVLIKR